MASLLKFRTDPLELQEEIKRRTEEADISCRENFIPARRIQAWIRGVLTRNHLRMLHGMATIIQRHWRGYWGRQIVDRYLIQRVHQMWQDYYDRMATRIQAAWRGYWVRKTRLDFREMRRWLDSVYRRNVETLESMRMFGFRRTEMENFENTVERESMLWILFILFKLHHLLRTAHRPGVITRIDETRSTVVEEMLKCLKYDLYVPRRGLVCGDCQIDRKPSSVFRGTYFERCEREIREFEKSLRAGDVPIFRSQPYDDEEKIPNRMDRRYEEILRRNEMEKKCSPGFSRHEGLRRKYRSGIKAGRPSSKSTGKDSCTSVEFNTFAESTCVEPIELYEEIRKMDCRLNRLRVKCPIHCNAPPSQPPLPSTSSIDPN